MAFGLDSCWVGAHPCDCGLGVLPPRCAHSLAFMCIYIVASQWQLVSIAHMNGVGRIRVL